MPHQTNHDTASRILDSVMQLILQGGIPAVTLSAVCKHANISKGGLVHHFPTKESLVESFVTKASELYLEMIRQTMSAYKPGKGRRAKAYVDLFLKDPDLLVPDTNKDCMAVMLCLIQGRGRYLDATRINDQIIRELKRDPLSTSAAETIIAAVDGVWLQSMIEPAEIIAPRAARIAKQLKSMIDREIANRQQKPLEKSKP